MPDPFTAQASPQIAVPEQSDTAQTKITVFEPEKEFTPISEGQTSTAVERKRARRDTVSILLDELRKAKPTTESFVSVDRTLPPPPSPATLVSVAARTRDLFANANHESEEITQARQDFIESLCRYTQEAQREPIMQLMVEFETRLFSFHLSQAEPELIDSYKQLFSLLSSAPNERSLPWQSRYLAVNHFLIHAARPDSICLGGKIGAQVLCLAQKLISHRPSRLAELLKSACLDGEWIAFDGKILKADEHSLKPGPEELSFRAGEHKRSYAAKIWQIFLLNNCLVRRTTPMIYSETPGRPGRDYGGQIVRTVEGKAINPKFGASISFFELALLSKFEFGESGVVLVNDLSFASQSAELLDASSQNLLLHFRTLNELAEIIARCKDAGKLPIMLAVDERRLLAEAYQDGINHAVNITDFNEYGNLRIYNPLLLPGMQRSARMSLQRLYNASLSNFKA